MANFIFMINVNQTLITIQSVISIRPMIAHSAVITYIENKNLKKKKIERIAL